jgi:hypothetical protein
MKDRSIADRSWKVKGKMRSEFGEKKMLLYATDFTCSMQIKGNGALRLRRSAKRMRNRLRRRYSLKIIDDQLYEMSSHAWLIQLEAMCELYDYDMRR